MAGPERLREDREFLLATGIRFDDEADELMTHDMAAMKGRLDAHIAAGTPTVMPDVGGGAAPFATAAKVVASVAVTGAIVGWLAWPGAEGGPPAESLALETTPAVVAIAEPEPEPEPELTGIVEPAAANPTPVPVAEPEPELVAEPEPEPEPAPVAEPVVAAAEPPRPRKPRARKPAPVVAEPVAVEPVAVEPVAEPAPEPTIEAPAPTSTLEAQLALYEQGKQKLRGGDLSGAIALFEQYKRDYPSGELRLEADVSLLEALVRAGKLAKADAQAKRLLARGSLGSRRAEILRVRGEVQARRGACDAAEATLQAALAAGARSLSRDDVDAAVAHCRAEAGAEEGP